MIIDLQRLLDSRISDKGLRDIFAAVRGPDSQCEVCKTSKTARVRMSAFPNFYPYSGWSPTKATYDEEILKAVDHGAVCAGSHFTQHISSAINALREVGLWKD